MYYALTVDGNEYHVNFSELSTANRVLTVCTVFQKGSLFAHGQAICHPGDKPDDAIGQQKALHDAIERRQAKDVFRKARRAIRMWGSPFDFAKKLTKDGRLASKFVKAYLEANNQKAPELEAE